MSTETVRRYAHTTVVGDGRTEIHSVPIGDVATPVDPGEVVADTSTPPRKRHGRRLWTAEVGVTRSRSTGRRCPRGVAR